MIFALLAPLPYVLVEPGTPSDTLGKVKGKPVLEIVGTKARPTKVFPTTGKLNLTSIWVTSPSSYLQTFELLRAWIDGERSVQPREVFYPKNVDPKEVIDENVADMKNSQLSAQLAALNYLDIPYTQNLIVENFTKNSPNKTILKKGDQLISYAGQKIYSASQLRALIISTESKRVQATILRAKKEEEITLQVRANAIGVLISEDYNLPFSIKVNLKNIGGPSAGLIFSLAVIEKLTKEDLVRNRNIAGTGTITPGGKVGPIGGIEEKLIGAARAGVTLFLAPAENCPDIRHIPKGLQVVPVENLTEAIAALRERDRERLPMCG